MITFCFAFTNLQALKALDSARQGLEAASDLNKEVEAQRDQVRCCMVQCSTVQFRSGQYCKIPHMYVSIFILFHTALHVGD